MVGGAKRSSACEKDAPRVVSGTVSALGGGGPDSRGGTCRLPKQRRLLADFAICSPAWATGCEHCPISWNGTVVRVEDRKAYLAALDSASIDQHIAPLLLTSLHSEFNGRLSRRIARHGVPLFD